MVVSSKPQLSERPHASDRFLVQLMCFVGLECRLVVELTINDDIDVVCKLIALARHLHPADMWNRGQNRKAFNQLTDGGLIRCTEKDDMANMDDGREFSTGAPKLCVPRVNRNGWTNSLP